MKKIVLLAAITIGCISVTFVESADVDFSGNWILTKRISSFGEQTPNVELVIKQTGNELTVTKNDVDAGKIVESHHTLDGTENINTESPLAGPMTIRSTSSWNNGILVIEGSSTFEGADKKVTNKWKTEYQLSENGAVLTVSRMTKTPFGEVIVSEVFSRK